MVGQTRWWLRGLQAAGALSLLLAGSSPLAHAADAGLPDLTGWDHPLCAGRPAAGPGICAIIETRSGAAGSPGQDAGDALLDRIATAIGPARFVLLGEVHDNPLHHRLRAALIARLVAGGPPTAVVLEHLRQDQQPALDAFRPEGADAVADARRLLAALDWGKSGWPAAAMFEPLFAVILSNRLRMLPGEPARGVVAKVARSGLSTLSEDERSRLGLERGLPADLAEALGAEIAGSHCGLLPPQAVPSMVLAQRYRDAHLADAMVAAAGAGGRAILLAGDGHVRADRAVPWHLRQRLPDAAVVSVVLAEVEPGQTDSEAYVPRSPGGTPAADVVVITPRAERADPCEAMRDRGARKG